MKIHVFIVETLPNSRFKCGLLLGSFAGEVAAPILNQLLNQQEPNIGLLDGNESFYQVTQTLE